MVLKMDEVEELQKKEIYSAICQRGRNGNRQRN